MPEPKRMCRTCRWLAVSSGERIYMSRAYPCNWPWPELPDSITLSFGFRRDRARMLPDSGNRCPTWEKRDA